MSKAFTKEDSDAAEVILPRRPPLPAGIPNYVTPRGLRLLRAELARLEAERAQAQVAGADPHRLALLTAHQNELKERIGGAQLVAPQAGKPDVVRFGVRVGVRGPDGETRHYTLVGVDEANAAEGRLAFTAPLARALLGRTAGDVVPVRANKTEEEVEIVDIAPDDAP